MAKRTNKFLVTTFLHRIPFLRLLFHRSGFTLIELLVVVAVLGILAAAALIALNPAKKISQSKDANDKTAFASVVNGLQSFYTQNIFYPAALNLLPPNDLVAVPVLSAPNGGLHYQANGGGTAVVLWFQMQFPKNGTVGTTVWCWDNTKSTAFEDTTGAPTASQFVCPP